MTPPRNLHARKATVALEKLLFRRLRSIGCDQSATTYKKSIRWRIYCLSVTSRSANFHNVIWIRVETSTERVVEVPSAFAMYS